MNGVQKRGLQAGYKCITLYTHLWLLLLIIIIIIIIIIIVFQLKQSAIIKQVLIGLACIAWARNYLITGCARETRKRERRPPPLFSPPPPPPTKLAPATQAMIGPTLEPGGEGPRAREIKVRSCYNGSSGSKMRKSRHLCKFQTMISSSLRKLHYGPLWHCG